MAEREETSSCAEVELTSSGINSGHSPSENRRLNEGFVANSVIEDILY